MDITEKEQRLIEELRKLNYGQVIAHIEGGKLLRIEVKENIRL